MTNDDKDVIMVVTDRFERRLSEECGRLRIDMATEFGSVRAEFGSVRAELGSFRADVATEFGKVRAEMAQGFGDLRTDMAKLRAEIVERNADLLKWMLIFGVTQTAAIVGLVKLWR